MAGDDAFVEFAAAHWVRLHKRAILLTGDEHLAADLVQMALLRAYRSWSKVEAADSATAYVDRILLNVFLSQRRRRRIVEVPTDSVPERSIEQVGESSDSPLWDLVLRLPARQRAVIVLRFYEDQSEAQIAEILGCAPGTVKSQAHAALSKLRAHRGHIRDKRSGHAI
jgi:RNA polymerase sigma-70 factor (sigma-E family)